MAKTKKAQPKKTTKNSKTTAARKSPKSKTTTTAKKATKTKTKKKSADTEETVIINRRASKDRRDTTDRRKKEEPVAVERRQAPRREKVARRRQIDPTTCERDYSDEEVEFMSALDEYKRTSGRMFPTCSEILEVFKKLGYEKRLPVPVIDETAGQPAQPAMLEQPLPTLAQTAV